MATFLHGGVVHGKSCVVTTSMPVRIDVNIIRGGGGELRGGIISHAVLNLLWEISHPHAVSRPLVGGGCCYLLMLCS